MKLNRFLLPMAIALAAMMAATGCKHGPPKVTNIPGIRATVPGGDNPDKTLPPGGAWAGSEPVDVGDKTPIGGGPTAIWELGDMDQDRAALAAHTVHFKFDSNVVLDNEQSNVAAVAQVLAANPNDKLLIEGHCDERGTEEYNRSLGERRALALREALAKAGVVPQRIRTISYGKDKPADPAHNDAAWSKNRRGEFILCHPR